MNMLMGKLRLKKIVGFFGLLLWLASCSSATKDPLLRKQESPTTAVDEGVPPPPPPPPHETSKKSPPPDIFEDGMEPPFDNGDQMQSEDDEFFARGRFFGFSLLAGTSQMTGTLSSLYYSPGFNSFEMQMYIFLDLNWAFEVAAGTSRHYFAIYSTKDIAGNLGRVDIRLRKYQAKLKYFWDLSFPKDWQVYALAGLASFERQTSFPDLDRRVHDSAPAFGAGFGLDIPVVGKDVYFRTEGIFWNVTFPDEFSSDLADAGFDNLAGDNWTLMGGLVLNW